MSYIGIEPVNNKPIFRFGCRMPGKQVTKNLLRGTVGFGDDTERAEDAIKVFLRIKPSINENEDIIQKLDDKTIVFKMPPDLTQSRKKLNIPVQYKYTFSNIFPSTVPQGEIFSGCVANHAKDLFEGKHCLLFTYGTTNAGKTFTVLGTGDQPGIIPRTLTTVFKSIKGKEYCNDRIIPCMFNSAFEIESAETLESERKLKSTILNWNPDKTKGDSYRSETCKSQISNQSSVDEILGEAVFQQMKKRLTNDTSIIEYVAEPEDRFSVWVSFAEIYNEAIYDLLQPVPSYGKRAQLKLAQDDHKNTYIKGLCQVNVQSEEEAYKVLLFGKNNLQVAATGSNLRSSRSHCIFSIKLMKCPNVEHPEKVVVSSFSICDLAGAERQKKALNMGIRLKESQKINYSLYVLSRCFSIIRKNQLNNEHKLIPFRESKLTQLFQNALLGKESVTMIVNVNSDRDLCEDTQHVLKASAIAKHIIVQSRPVVGTRPTRTFTFSQLIRKKTNRSSPIRSESCIKAKATDIKSIATIDDSTIPEGEQSNLGSNKRQEQKYQVGASRTPPADSWVGRLRSRRQSRSVGDSPAEIRSPNMPPGVPRGGAVKPPKPKRKITAFNFFVQSRQGLGGVNFSQENSKMWEELSGEAKSKFVKMADDDLMRFKTEKLSYNKFVKGEELDAPKLPRLAFHFFSKDERPKVEAANPGYKNPRINKELGRRWANVDQSTKTKFEEQAKNDKARYEKDKARYEKEMNEYKKRAKGPPVKPESGEEEEDD